MMFSRFVLVGFACALAGATPALAQEITPSAQIGFSPDTPAQSAQVLVLSVIDSAKTSIRLMGYSFTARDVTKALIRAKMRGVDVQLVLDEESNRKNPDSMQQISNMTAANIPVRLDGHFAIQHDKAIVVDEKTTETGSFNFTHSAEIRNSENAVVIWNMPELAHDMLTHWQSRWNFGHSVQ